MNQEKIGKFIRDKRKEKDLTQEELASILRVSNRTISKWENGVCLPDYAMINDLCKELDISINEFLSGEEIDDESYQKTLEENMIKSINYKVRKNNRKIFFIFTIVLILIAAIGYCAHHIYFYFELNSPENIKIKNVDVGNRKIINDKFEANDLANQNIGNMFNIYIPEGWKLENDVTKSYMIKPECRLFFKNYRVNDKNDGYTYDGYIRVCTDDDFYNSFNDPYDVFYNYDEATQYDMIKKYLEMEDINIFSSKEDIKKYNTLVDNYGHYSYEDEEIVSNYTDDEFETHLVEGDYDYKAYYDYTKYENFKFLYLYGKYSTIDYYKQTKGYGKHRSTYRMEIVDSKNSLTEEDIKNIIYSFKSIQNEIDF